MKLNQCHPAVNGHHIAVDMVAGQTPVRRSVTLTMSRRDDRVPPTVRVAMQVHDYTTKVRRRRRMDRKKRRGWA